MEAATKGADESIPKLVFSHTGQETAEQGGTLHMAL